MISAIKSMLKTNYENLKGVEFKNRFESKPDAVLLDVKTALEMAEYSLKYHRHIDIINSAFPKEINKLDKKTKHILYIAATETEAGKHVTIWLRSDISNCII